MINFKIFNLKTCNLNLLIILLSHQILTHQKMTTENLKAFFQLSIDESIDLENISVVNTPTKKEFFDSVPDYYEPSLKLEKDEVELQVYFAFDWIYVIDDNDVTYKFKTMEGVENLFSNLVNESEIEYNNKRESLQDLIKYLNGN